MSDGQLTLDGASGYPEPYDKRPVPALPKWPERLSQTLLAHEDRCPRSAYLYVKHSGLVKSHEMDRGTVAHIGFEKLMVDLIQNGEESMIGRRAGSDTVPASHAVEALSFQTGALVEEVLRELGDTVHVPAGEADVARVCLYHAALGLDVDPEHVLGIERKFVLDLESGWEVSVKADLIHSPETGHVVVDDYKTSLWVPPPDEWKAFQVKTALVAVLYGQPVDLVLCPRCDATGVEPDNGSDDHLLCSMCAGKTLIEVRGDRVGSGWTRFTGRELYPRKDLRRDGKLHRNEGSWTRLEMDEFRADLERAGERLRRRMEGEEARWPARKGSWCSMCPAEHECPIPAAERDHAGAVRDLEHAQDLWEWVLAMKQRVATAEGEVKAYMKQHEGPDLRVGDEAWAFALSETRSVRRRGGTADWEGLETAIGRAAELGEEFDLDYWLRTSRRNEFKKVKVPVESREELPGGNGDGSQPAERGTDEASLDKRWGVDAPW